MDKPIDIQLKFPGGLIARDQRVILETLEKRFHERRFDSPEEGERAVQAIIEEYLGFSTQFETEPKFVWLKWFSLVALLLAGGWLYWIWSQGLGQ